jgi:hypothetical protein
MENPRKLQYKTYIVDLPKEIKAYYKNKQVPAYLNKGQIKKVFKSGAIKIALVTGVPTSKEKMEEDAEQLFYKDTMYYIKKDQIMRQQ